MFKNSSTVNKMNFRKKSRARKNSTNFMLEPGGKWRPPGQQRLSRIEPDEESVDEDLEPRSDHVTDWAEVFFGRQSMCNDTSMEQQDEVHLTKKQTLILSTLVPDEILLLDKFDAGEPNRFVGVLMMADVSGYTALSERYNSMSKGGTYRLTVTLNTYLGALIEIIYSHGGDIIKFAGDAFLALWKTDKRTFLTHTIHTVIACALVIQHSYARYETDVKVNLKVKLAISAGNLMFSPIGAGIDMNYVIFGLPVMEAKLAESVCASGEVKLAPSSWAHCYSRNYDHIVHDDGHVTVKAILYDPHENDVTKPYLGFSSLLRQVKATNRVLENVPEFIWESPKNLNSSELLRKNEVLGLRKAILIAEEKDLGSSIRNFMIRPVLTQIDAHQPLEYLTEMRQVSILFVTLKPRECPPAQLITIVNNSYQITCEIVYKSMGCVNKIILFDKDVMILVVFGLRGFKHESEAQAALKCAYSIRKSVAALDGVDEVSIGVTTGQVYCGVVGHPLRREFTVIGAIVNKAARLMCNFRNKISCDEATFVKSKMSKNGFTLQPEIQLKGIGSAGKIYEYTEEIRVREFRNIPMVPPLLDRSDETEYFERWLEESQNYRDVDALLLIGQSRIGKSKMLEWLSRISTNMGFRVCFLSLTSIHSANPYLALSQIVNQMLGLGTEPTTGFIKEQRIVDLLKIYDENLCYLNNVIKVRFAYHEGAYSLDEAQREIQAKGIFKRIIQSVEDTYVILLDDLQNLDASSWEYISIMLTVNKIFTVLTVTRGKFSSVHKWLYSVFVNHGIRKIVLGPLSFEWIPALACQVLDVDAVPNDLCNALKAHCKGMPGLVESLIVHLFSNGAIELIKITDEELETMKQEDLQFPDPELLKPQALNAKDQETLDQLREEEASGEISICIVTNKDELNTNFNVHNTDALIMVQIDSLTPYQQLLLKIASVIGNVVSRDLLENIMYENDPVITAKAVNRLFGMKVVSCASAKSKFERMRALLSPSVQSAKPDKPECECDFEYDPENSNGLPKYAYCKVMKFRNKNSRKTCYELLPMNQKKEFHTRVVNYLEKNEQKCPDCGGTLIVLPPITMFKEDEEDATSHPSCIFESKEADLENSDNENANTKLKTTKSENYRKSDQSASYLLNVGRSSSDTIHNLNTALKVKAKSSEVGLESRKTSKRVTVSSLLYLQQEKCEQSIDETTVLGMLRKIIEAKKITDWHYLGIVDSKDEIENKDKESIKSFSVPIEKGVSRTNFKTCTCSDLNIMIYKQLVHHALQAEMKIKAIEFLTVYCYLCLLADNIIEPICEKLDEAEFLCLEKATNEQQQLITKPERKRFLGRIYSLKAAEALRQDKLLSGKIEIEKAIRIYKLPVYNGSKLLSIKDVFLVKNQQYINNEKQMKADSVFCLNVATMIHAALGEEKISRKCALCAINLVQKIDCRVTDLCDAFTVAIQIEIDRGCPENTLEIEKTLKHVIRRLPHPIKTDELFALGKLFLATFRARLARAELAPGIRSAYRSIVIGNFLRAFNVTIAIIPDLFYILVCRHRIEEAIAIAQLSLRLHKNKNTQECETWYYALCMDLILDAGYQLEAPPDICRYADIALQRKESGSARRRLVMNMWTYWLRMDADLRAKKFESEALTWLSLEDKNGTLTTLLTALRFAEGLLESLSRKLDDLRKVVDLMELRSIADRELNNLEKDCRLMRIVYSRWMRLKGNSLGISGRVTASAAMNNQALEEGKRVNNVLEEALCRATLSSARHWLQCAKTTFAPWQTAEDLTSQSWAHMLYKMTARR